MDYEDWNSLIQDEMHRAPRKPAGPEYHLVRAHILALEAEQYLSSDVVSEDWGAVLHEAKATAAVSSAHAAIAQAMISYQGAQR